MKEKKARVEDALHATRAAVEEGVVPGGGVALIRVQKSLEKLEGANEDQTIGVRILHRAIEEPLRQIVDNAGEDAAVILNRVKEGKGSFGYNAATGEFGDMLEVGILDPTKVTRLALQNAASVAGLLLTTEVMIAESPKDEEHAHGAGGMPPAAWAEWTCKVGCPPEERSGGPHPPRQTPLPGGAEPGKPRLCGAFFAPGRSQCTGTSDRSGCSEDIAGAVTLRRAAFAPAPFEEL